MTGLIGVGDSLMLGAGAVRDPDTAASPLVGRLAAELRPGTHTVRARYGAMANQLFELVADVERFDLMLVSAGVNDAHAGTEPADTSDALAVFVASMTSRGRVVVIGVPPVAPTARLSRIRKRNVGARLVRLNELYPAVCAAVGASFFDPARLGDVMDPALWSADGLHMSEAGYDRLADELATFLREE